MEPQPVSFAHAVRGHGALELIPAAGMPHILGTRQSQERNAARTEIAPLFASDFVALSPLIAGKAWKFRAPIPVFGGGARRFRRSRAGQGIGNYVQAEAELDQLGSPPFAAFGGASPVNGGGNSWQARNPPPPAGGGSPPGPREGKLCEPEGEHARIRLDKA